MKHEELMNEVKRAYIEYIHAHPFKKDEVDFESFLIGYTTCMYLCNKKNENVIDN